MRKLTAIFFALLIATSAFASPRNESKDRDVANPVSRIVRKIKAIIVHVLDDPSVVIPVPNA